jgi:hypothetical protein
MHSISLGALVETREDILGIFSLATNPSGTRIDF